jgi:hypothetical protein
MYFGSPSKFKEKRGCFATENSLFFNYCYQVRNIGLRITAIGSLYVPVCPQMSPDARGLHSLARTRQRDSGQAVELVDKKVVEISVNLHLTRHYAVEKPDMA